MPVPSNAKPIIRPSLRDEVYTTLLDWVVEGKLQPGEKIRDVELAGHLGVSRTPVRKALRRLENKNLVHTAPGRWTRVNDVSLKEANKMEAQPKSINFAENECHVLVVEPHGVVNTGDTQGDMTAANDVWI